MKKLIAALLIGLLPSAGMAQQLLPQWHMTGQEACYGFNDAKLLLEFDSELVMYRDVSYKLRLSNDELKLAVGDLTKSLDAQKAASAVLLDNNKQLEGQLKDAITAKNKAEANKMPGMGWTVAGGLLLIAGGVLFGYYVWPGHTTSVTVQAPPAQ